MKTIFQIDSNLKYLAVSSMEETTEYILTELDEVNEIIVDDMSQTMKNVVNLDDLSDKSESIKEFSQSFHQSSRLLRVKEYWRDKREYFIAVFIIFVVIVVLIIGMTISIVNKPS